jgi:hypothetical protein
MLSVLVRGLLLLSEGGGVGVVAEVEYRYGITRLPTPSLTKG